MRNILVHGYFGINTELVWSAVVNDLPELKRKVGAMFKDMSTGKKDGKQ